jgi:hypothetical protein
MQAFSITYHYLLIQQDKSNSYFQHKLQKYAKMTYLFIDNHKSLIIVLQALELMVSLNSCPVYTGKKSSSSISRSE